MKDIILQKKSSLNNFLILKLMVAHILVNFLIDGGYAKDINDVFKGILRKDSPCYVPKVKVEVPYIIDIIHKAGGLAVMAHPKLVTSDEYVLEMLDYDFDGMEVISLKAINDDECGAI